LEFAEVMSITSSEWMLNDHDFVVGAGGVERAVPRGGGIAPRTYRPKPRDRPETSYIPNYLNGEDEDTSTPRRRSLGEEYRDDASSIVSGYGEGGQTRWTDSLGEDEVWDDNEDDEGSDEQIHRHPSTLRDWDDEHDGPRRRRSRAAPEVIQRRPGDDALDLDSDEEDDEEEDDDRQSGGGVVFAPRGRPLRDDELSGAPFGSGS
jgi:hypothetical protein